MNKFLLIIISFISSLNAEHNTMNSVNRSDIEFSAEQSSVGMTNALLTKELYDLYLKKDLWEIRLKNTQYTSITSFILSIAIMIYYSYENSKMSIHLKKPSEELYTLLFLGNIADYSLAVALGTFIGRLFIKQHLNVLGKHIERIKQERKLT